MDKTPPARRDPNLGKPYAEMTRRQKLRFVGKLFLCILTFGFAFPNVMSD